VRVRIQLSITDVCSDVLILFGWLAGFGIALLLGGLSSLLSAQG